MAKYTVVHPVRHAGKLHERGTEIELDDTTAERLQEYGSVHPIAFGPVAPAAPAKPVGLSTPELEKLTKDQLTEYALATFNLTLGSHLTKPEMIQAISGATIIPTTVFPPAK